MKSIISKVKSHLLLKLNITLPIRRLRHVTTETGVIGIIRTEAFKKSPRESEVFRDLSFWSAEVLSGDTERARQEAYEKVRHLVAPEMAAGFQEDIKEQFANSLAFDNSSSRYGNFVFSFPLSDLPDAYKDQHCRGGEPQLRVLGTAMYRREIAHAVVIHSPETDRYNDFPLVPVLSRHSEPFPFVYQRDGDVGMWWTPESTSTTIKVRILEEGRMTRTCALDQPCLGYSKDGKCPHEHRCVWNHLIIAFHLPEGQHFAFPKEKLLQNLSTCHGATDKYLKDTMVTKEEAEGIIREFMKI
ncbi:uncharacterized protein LOC128468342 [Spea bombifrons]|uniref:uncharacterized protein LOC128468342 n=1 Tax=Spea bombifrons TaxID=233779 RepID=UPI002349095D|nr:uncharacterized protein LOC128468342 [Spea bombifrons]